MFRTNSSFRNPSSLRAPTPLSNLQLQREEMPRFLLLRNTQALHQNSIWFGNETTLVHFPMQTAQSSIASTHGALLSRKALRK